MIRKGTLVKIYDGGFGLVSHFDDNTVPTMCYIWCLNQDGTWLPLWLTPDDFEILS